VIIAKLEKQRMDMALICKMLKEKMGKAPVWIQGGPRW
jgi:hypothetical protein